MANPVPQQPQSNASQAPKIFWQPVTTKDSDGVEKTVLKGTFLVKGIKYTVTLKYSNENLRNKYGLNDASTNLDKVIQRIVGEIGTDTLIGMTGYKIKTSLDHDMSRSSFKPKEGENRVWNKLDTLQTSNQPLYQTMQKTIVAFDDKLRLAAGPQIIDLDSDEEGIFNANPNTTNPTNPVNTTNTANNVTNPVNTATSTTNTAPNTTNSQTQARINVFEDSEDNFDFSKSKFDPDLFNDPTQTSIVERNKTTKPSDLKIQRDAPAFLELDNKKFQLKVHPTVAEGSCALHAVEGKPDNNGKYKSDAKKLRNDLACWLDTKYKEKKLPKAIENQIIDYLQLAAKNSMDVPSKFKNNEEVKKAIANKKPNEDFSVLLTNRAVFNAYLERVRDIGEYLTQPELAAAAQSLNKTIILFQVVRDSSEPDKVIYGPLNEEGVFDQSIELNDDVFDGNFECVYYNGINHYEKAELVPVPVKKSSKL